MCSFKYTVKPDYVRVSLELISVILCLSLPLQQVHVGCKEISREGSCMGTLWYKVNLYYKN